MAPHFYDPYDFTDDSSDEDSAVLADQEDVDMDATTDAESVSTQSNLEAGLSTASSASYSHGETTPSIQSSYTSYEHEWQESQESQESQDDYYSDDEGMTSDSSSRTFTYRRSYGRGLNSVCDRYRLPADEEERRRLRQYAWFFRIRSG